MSKHYIYGYHAVVSLIQSHPQLITQLFCSRDVADQRRQQLLSLAEMQQLSCEQIAKNKLNEWLPEVNHQGIVAICRALPHYSDKDLSTILKSNTNAKLILVLDGIQDPHNLGACLRSALAFGVNAVIIPKDKAVGVTPTVRKIACGAAEALPVITVTNLARTLKQLQKQGIWLVGFTSDAETELASVDLQGDIAVILGGENQGLRRLTKNHCDYLARIPIQATMESLNVSVAAGIGLYEVSRQRALHGS